MPVAVSFLGRQQEMQQEEDHLLTLLDASYALVRGEPSNAIDAWLASVCTRLNWPLGEIWSHSGRSFHLESAWCNPAAPNLHQFTDVALRLSPPLDRTILGEAYRAKGLIYVPDFAERGYVRSQSATQYGLRSCLCVPILAADDVSFGLLMFDRRQRQNIDAMMTAVQVACDELGLYLSLQTAVRANLPDAAEAPINVVANLYADFRNQIISGPNGSLRLTGIEWSVFQLLAVSQGNLVPQSDLTQKIWGAVDHESRNSLYEVVSRIRSHLAIIGVEPTNLRVVPRKGYLFHSDL